MVLTALTRGRFPFAAAWCVLLAVAGCGDPPFRQVLEVRLYEGERQPVELASGDTVAPGAVLFMTVTPRRPLHLYVVSEDAAGERKLIYPCKTWGRSDRLAAGRPHRLPEEGFWRVRSVTQRERLLVIAGATSVDVLDAVFADSAISEPCAAQLGDETDRWIDGLLRSHGSFRLLWAGRKTRTWISTFDLEGVADRA